jgi:CDP-diacylglycerol--glycerol-3-phosphate 3-phosphatidyltransferase
MMRGPIARTLVAARWMRGVYGAVKAATFGWVLMLQPLPTLYPHAWAEWSPILQSVTTTLVLTSVAICLVRGLPVIAEFVVDQKVFPQISAGSR